jgi:hypothetical protein
MRNVNALPAPDAYPQQPPIAEVQHAALRQGDGSFVPETPSEMLVREIPVIEPAHPEAEVTSRLAKVAAFAGNLVANAKEMPLKASVAIANAPASIADKIGEKLQANAVARAEAHDERGVVRRNLGKIAFAGLGIAGAVVAVKVGPDVLHSVTGAAGEATSGSKGTAAQAAHDLVGNRGQSNSLTSQVLDGNNFDLRSSSTPLDVLPKSPKPITIHQGDGLLDVLKREGLKRPADRTKAVSDLRQYLADHGITYQAKDGPRLNKPGTLTPKVTSHIRDYITQHSPKGHVNPTDHPAIPGAHHGGSMAEVQNKKPITPSATAPVAPKLPTFMKSYDSENKEGILGHAGKYAAFVALGLAGLAGIRASWSLDKRREETSQATPVATSTPVPAAPVPVVAPFEDTSRDVLVVGRRHQRKSSEPQPPNVFATSGVGSTPAQESLKLPGYAQNDKKVAGAPRVAQAEPRPVSAEADLSIVPPPAAKKQEEYKEGLRLLEALVASKSADASNAFETWHRGRPNAGYDVWDGATNNVLPPDVKVDENGTPDPNDPRVQAFAFIRRNYLDMMRQAEAARRTPLYDDADKF